MSEFKIPAGDWDFEPNHTSIEAVARHMMFTKVRGKFTEFSGTVHVGDTPEESRVEITIQAPSIDTGVAARDAHLRSPDFLDVEKYPTLSFRSTKVVAAGEDGLAVTGDLTIRDVTKPITLDVKFEGTAVDPWGGTRAIFSASAELAREEWGMTWNAALEAGGVLVSKTFQIEIEAQAVKAEQVAA